MRCFTSVRSADSAITSCEAKVLLPGVRCHHVHPTPGSTSVTTHTSLGISGCLISNRRPTSMAGPSSAVIRSTEAVQSDHCSTQVKTSQTTLAGASISMLLSVFMYQMVRLQQLH